ncbi:MAG: nuclear transport factor 2 family protein [Anaerolineales bacterium]
MPKYQLSILIITLCLTACGISDSGNPWEPASAPAVRESGARCEKIAAAHAEFWTAHGIERFEGVYTQDIIHDDGGTLLEGAEDVSSMAGTVFMIFPQMQVQTKSLYVADTECLGVFAYFPLKLGGYEFTADDPLIEIDLLRTRDERIAYWGLFESHDTQEKKFIDAEGFQQLEEDRSLLESYAEAWSTKDAQSVVDLYAGEAIREDLTFGERQSGREQIRIYGRAFFKRFPLINWDLRMPFSNDLSGVHVAGGTFTIQSEDKDAQTCTIEAAVLLWTSGEKIVKESVFYTANSLVACGWAQ